MTSNAASRLIAVVIVTLLVAGLFTAGAARAQQTGDPGTGAVTNLALPRFVSLKGVEGNARRGPGLTHRIDWVFTRRDMPLQITAEFENWRLVRDKDGEGGWVHYTLLSGVRTVVVIDGAAAELHAQPDAGSDTSALLEPGVVARVSECTPGWCRVSAGGEKGWSPKSSFWGVGPDEVLD